MHIGINHTDLIAAIIVSVVRGVVQCVGNGNPPARVVVCEVGLFTPRVYLSDDLTGVIIDCLGRTDVRMDCFYLLAWAWASGTW